MLIVRDALSRAKTSIESSQDQKGTGTRSQSKPQDGVLRVDKQVMILGSWIYTSTETGKSM
jgi:hypothetical protein